MDAVANAWIFFMIQILSNFHRLGLDLSIYLAKIIHSVQPLF